MRSWLMLEELIHVHLLWSVKKCSPRPEMSQRDVLYHNAFYTISRWVPIDSGNGVTKLRRNKDKASRL